MSRPFPLRARRAPRGFTLIELLVVIAVLGLLVGLLTPAVMRAVQRGRESAVAADINLMAASLSAFKDQYGDYPPSRIMLREDGVFPVNDATPLSSVTSNPSPTDLTVGQLAERSLRYMRKFFPRAAFSTTTSPFGTSFNTGPGTYYDFNGDGSAVDSTGNPQQYILEGHECLTFFLGGIPSSSGTAMAGFGKDPKNPFVGDWPAPLGTSNRNPPLFEFVGNRLIDEDGDGIPGYIDSLANGNPATGGEGRFFAYFSAYGTNGYDPNDVNFRYTGGAFEQDNTGTTLMRAIQCTFGVPSGSGATNEIQSPAPNPYTNGPALQPATSSRAVAFHNANTYQIIAAGSDRLYGVGGQYNPDSQRDSLNFAGEPSTTQAGDPTVTPMNPTIRQREGDNITNFSTGRLE